MFYVEENEKIVLFDEDRQKIVDTLAFMPQYAELEIKETTRPIVDFEFADTQEYLDKKASEREESFKKDFFNIENFGWYRKSPKGYSSAVESINTAFNAVSLMGTLPAGSLIFYEQPDFYKEEECTEEWLVEHQILSEAMTSQEFGQFYAAFITAWNAQEHASAEEENADS